MFDLHLQLKDVRAEIEEVDRERHRLKNLRAALVTKRNRITNRINNPNATKALWYDPVVVLKEDVRPYIDEGLRETGMSLADLARKSGLNRRHIYDILAANGRKYITQSTADLLLVAVERQYMLSSIQTYSRKTHEPL